MMNNLLEQRNDRKIGSYNFDFHRELAGDNFENIVSLMNVIEPEIMGEEYRMFIQSRESNKTYYQGGVFRTNCLDCLDRTNFAQANISKLVLKHIFKLLDKKQLEKDPNVKIFDLETQRKHLYASLKRMWDENGDKLSNQYAGTNSNISGVLEEGK